MCTVLLPPGDNPIAVNKYIVSYDNNSSRFYRYCSTSGIYWSRYLEAANYCLRVVLLQCRPKIHGWRLTLIWWRVTPVRRHHLTRCCLTYKLRATVRSPSDGAPRKCCSTWRGCVLGRAWPLSVYANFCDVLALPIFVLGLSFKLLEDFGPCLKSS